MFKQILIPVCLYLYHVSAASVQKLRIQFIHTLNRDMVESIQCCRMAEIKIERRPEETFKMVFIPVLRQEAEYTSAVVVENNYIYVYLFEFRHHETVHIMIECNIADDEGDRPAQCHAERC